RQVPFLFFSTGESPDYHTTRDVPEAIDYEKLTAATVLIERLVRRAAAAEELPEWCSERTPWLGEAIAIRDVFELLLEHQERLNVPLPQRVIIRSQVERMGRWI